MKAIQFVLSVPRYAFGRLVGGAIPQALWGPVSQLHYGDIPEPPFPANDWVKVKTRMGGICGSDVNMIHLRESLGMTPFCSFPAVLGHEGFGHISEVGPGVRSRQVGERVVLEPTLWCRPRGFQDLCPACQRGETNLCERTAEGKMSAGMFIGTCRDTAGTWSETFVAHESQLYPVPVTISDESAVLVEPFATALHSVLHNFPGDRETVLVVGGGTIGLCVVAAIRALGSQARVLVLAKHTFQAEAADKMGASEVIRGGGVRAFEDVAKLVGATLKKPMLGSPVMIGGADTVFECVGSQSAVNSALSMARSGGRVAVVGFPATLKVDWSIVLAKELTIRASWVYNHAEEFGGKQQSTFDIALDLLARGRADLAPMLTHVFPLKDYKRALAATSSRKTSRVIKAAFRFD